MTTLPVRRLDGELVIGPPAPHPARTAVLEARGALLVWDVCAGPLPSARIWDETAAHTWLWEVYGPVAAAAVRDGAASIRPEPTTTSGSARAAALSQWRRSWWPASYHEAVPALDQRLVTADLVLALAELTDLVEDSAAVERELAGALAALAVLGQELPGPPWAGAAESAAQQLRLLAEDHGLPVPVAVPDPAPAADFALAAGGPIAMPGTVIAAGESPVDPARVVARSADFAASAQWQITRSHGALQLEVTVPAAPGSTTDRLQARYAGRDLTLQRRGGSYSGTLALTTADLLLPAAQRTVVVHSPGLADLPELAATDQAALLDLARAHLHRPDGLAEHEAAAREAR